VIAIRIGTSRVRQEKGQASSKRPAKTDPEKQHGNEGVEDVMRAHRDASR
jgi:hypothetical protein